MISFHVTRQDGCFNIMYTIHNYSYVTMGVFITYILLFRTGKIRFGAPKFDIISQQLYITSLRIWQ